MTEKNLNQHSIVKKDTVVKGCKIFELDKAD